MRGGSGDNNDGNEGRNLTSEEVEIWDFVTRNDKRWKKIKTPKEKLQNKKSENTKPLIKKTDYKPESKIFKRAEFPYLEAGEVAGVDRSTADKLRRGKMKIEAVLDLHGMIRDEALDNLRGFVFHCSERRKRCALIITGKGSGILKNSLPQWLNIDDIRPHILMFNYAQPKDGGDGAVYVLLRRK